MKMFLLLLPVIIFTIPGEISAVSVPERDQPYSLEARGSSSLLNDWITLHLKTIRNGKFVNHHHRQSAYIGVALYESVVEGDKKYRSLSGQLIGYQHPQGLTAGKDICWASSANTALANMFRFLYPRDPATMMRFDSLENAWKQHLVKVGYTEASVAAGAKYGASISQSVIEWSKTDNIDKAISTYNVPERTGLWEPTPPGFVSPITPFLGNVRTFVKGSIDNTLPPPPLAFSIDEKSDFFKMVDEVYKISTMLDDGQKATALFWDDLPDGKSVTSGGHWASILKTVMEEQHVSLIVGSHLYAALFISTNDASIGCFKAKYTYNLLRPVTYIQKYMNHPEWFPIIATPPHPEYPAAHATISMAAATMLTLILGDRISFTDNTYSYLGFKAHHFNSFTEAAKEAGMSKLFGGIHYLPSIEAGFKQGKEIAENIAKSIVFKI